MVPRHSHPLQPAALANGEAPRAIAAEHFHCCEHSETHDTGQRMTARRRFLKQAAAGLLLCGMGAAMLACMARHASDVPATGQHWVSAWGAAPVAAGPALKAQTVRQVIRTSIGGSGVRIRLSNLFGAMPLTIGPVRVARHAGGPAIKPGTDQAVTFDGKTTVTIAPGGDVLSDAIASPVAALEELAVSLYLPGGTPASTVHQVGNQTVFLATGDTTAAIEFTPEGEADDTRYFLTDVEVAADPAARTIVALGDSITDGVGSTENQNARWPDALAKRLQADPALATIAVVNSGIAGNRIVHDAAAPYRGPSSLSRFDRDVLNKPGVRWVLLLQGGNDISASDVLTAPEQKVSAQQIIDGMKTLIARAHARGIKVWGATLLPRGGTTFPAPPTAAAKAKREAVNAWIRDSGAFDAVIDFDEAMRDPSDPDRLLPAYDSGDHLHPNDAGYQAMAAAIDLRLFAGDR
ncbi:SGNH/GDSL hydrolase family protein [Nannocystis radixulma]|uniref:SGNH/GDSL hydrolase family protein n=1 Tax=Nannocystis radixulma TaxID=2995305 RepID=A0ABT5B209_9BACT|nr:SGNH/GDSL hydrolase family protein [Nannocystis radixulma]MDC0667101.1 SGNH/GDSL hydrolase family protein [Nannocystis radixulma]